MNVIKTKQILALAISSMMLASCQSTKIQYPEQTKVAPTNQSSALITSQKASDFRDADIQVPANFDPQGLENCTFDINNESDMCPLKKPVIRVYFANNSSQTKLEAESKALDALNNESLGLMLESQLAGVNRFRIVTRDTTTDDELGQQFTEQSAVNLAKVMANKSTLRPDFILKIDTLKTADRFYAEYNGVAQYAVELVASVIDPYTKEKLAYPNVGKIRVQGTDVKQKHELVYTEVSGRYYTGFNYNDQANVQAVFNKMASRAFDIMISRLLTEMPVTAQVMAFKGNQLTLDRGRNAGLLKDDTVILFKYEMGFVEPIAVARVTPSSESAIAHIVKWKQSDAATELAKKTKNGILKLTASERVFAVSVGLPESFTTARM